MKLAAVTYLVRDYDEAILWFTKVLRFVLIEDTKMSATKRWVVVAASADANTRLLLAKADGPGQIEQIGRAAGGRVAYFLYTDHFERDHARMVTAGVTFKEQPRHESYGTVAVFVDYYGNLWDLIEPKAGL